MAVAAPAFITIGCAPKEKDAMKESRTPKTAGLTRRDFAKATAIAGFAIGSPKLGMAATNGDTLKAGVIGCGGRASGDVPRMLANNNVKLVAMADTFTDRIDSCKKKILENKDANVKARFAVEDDMCFTGLDAYKKVLATDVDFVMLCSSPYARPRHIEAATAAGKHIFAEKPVATDPAGVKRVIAAAEKHKAAGLTFVAGTQRRHQPDYMETVKQIQDGAIGDVIALRAMWCGKTPWTKEHLPEWSDLEFLIRNWLNVTWAGGDNICEQHIHNIDVCNWVMGGPPKYVYASGGRAWKPNDKKYGDNFDHFSCDYEYEGGVHMFSMCRHWYESADNIGELVLGSKGQSNCKDLNDSRIDGQVQETIDFVNSVTGKGPYFHEAKQVAESTMTSIIGRMSAYTGQRVSFERAMAEGESIVPKVLDFSRKYELGPVPHPGTPKKG
jgi:myo-inositol 2-dehydrogenase/D-chiro-inositol 1-dehydrogenase